MGLRGGAALRKGAGAPRGPSDEEINGDLRGDRQAVRDVRGQNTHLCLGGGFNICRSNTGSQRGAPSASASSTQTMMS